MNPTAGSVSTSRKAAAQWELRGNDHQGTATLAPSSYITNRSRGVDDRLGGGVWTRALALHSATVVTISGNVDAANIDRVRDFATRFLLVGNAVILDLALVSFCSAQSVSLLFAIDDACRSAHVQWALVSSPAVKRVMQLADCDAALPTASSVPTALRQLAELTRARRVRALTTMPTESQVAQRPALFMESTPHLGDAGSTAAR